MTTMMNSRGRQVLATCTFALALMLAGALPAAAQHHGHGAMQPSDTTRGMPGGGMMGMMHGGQGGMMGMMQGGMMQRMMQDPVHRAGMLVTVLPTMREPLGLTDDQVARLEQRAVRFEEQRQAHRQQMVAAREQLQELADGENAAPERVRTILEEAAVHRARMQALAYETAVEMKRVLTPAQRTQLDEMPPMQLQRHAMANMTMMEMMQAMHGGGMMDGCPMMQGGMMGTMHGAQGGTMHGAQGP